MFKGILILGLVLLVFVLGANYLLVYTVNQKAVRERQRQDNVYWKTFNTIVFYGQHPGQATEQGAKIALDEAHQSGLSKNRERILQTYFEDLESCYQGQRESCKKANSDMNEAIKAPR